MKADEDAVAKAIGDLMRRAFRARASDIHIEPVGGGLRTRFRVDGVMQDPEELPAEVAGECIARAKAMAGLNTDVRDLPQDGRVLLDVDGKTLDLRVACVPTVHGERITMRILDASDVRYTLDDFGLNPGNVAVVRDLLKRPNGILLSTGPTGSGKTTMMYAMLLEIDRRRSTVFSIEDPVEYILPDVSQIAVRPARGLTFAAAARAVMRQDPDYLMIGEIRDAETAQVAVQAALTGHLVLTQLHAATAPGALKRLLDIGLEPFLVNQSVIGVVSQRLVRELCVQCRREAAPNPDLLPAASAEALKKLDGTFFEPVGCDACKGTGFRGRTAIQEILVTDARVHAAVTARDLAAIRAAAREGGMHSLMEDGLLMAARGVTSVGEVLRVAVTGPHE